MSAKRKNSNAEPLAKQEKKRKYLSQTDAPSFSLDEALRVPKAIMENYASQPTSGLKVAKALGMQPNSGQFRSICVAAIAYGLLSGSPQSEMKVEPLAKRILRPLEEGDDMTAKREATLKPRIVREFLSKYNNFPIPRNDITINILTEMGVPEEKAESVLRLIVESATRLGLITEIKGKKYVDLSSQLPNTGADLPLEEEVAPEESDDSTESSSAIETIKTQPPASDDARRRRVFIAHGKNRALIEPIKKLLKFGELEAVVAVERQSVSQPVPDKVMEDLRGCGAAIIHIEGEQRFIDQQANEHVVLNPNVLIEIGAALALYGRRLILLVKEGVTVPSNLQGLLEVKYSGDTLDGEATIRLLEAINDIKNHPLPA